MHKTPMKGQKMSHSTQTQFSYKKGKMKTFGKHGIEKVAFKKDKEGCTKKRLTLRYMY